MEVSHLLMLLSLLEEVAEAKVLSALMPHLAQSVALADLALM